MPPTTMEKRVTHLLGDLAVVTRKLVMVCEERLKLESSRKFILMQLVKLLESEDISPATRKLVSHAMKVF